MTILCFCRYPFCELDNSSSSVYIIVPQALARSLYSYLSERVKTLTPQIQLWLNKGHHCRALRNRLITRRSRTGLAGQSWHGCHRLHGRLSPDPLLVLCKCPLQYQGLPTVPTPQQVWGRRPVPALVAPVFAPVSRIRRFLPYFLINLLIIGVHQRFSPCYTGKR